MSVLVAMLLSVSAWAQPATGKQEAAKVLSGYYAIKDALVATSAAEASQKAADFLKTLKSIDPVKLPAAEQKSFAGYTRTLEKYGRAIQKNTDVEKQRTQFELLSKEMTAFTKAFKPEKAYIQYCPMAADGKGASWLSSKKEIANPYYGSRMLKCGKVTEEI